MASTDWIESAAHEVKPPTGGMDSNYQHVLTMARADARREAEDRVLAARAIRRVGGMHAVELLAMLGLGVS